MAHPSDHPVRGPLVDVEALGDHPHLGDVDVPDLPDHGLVVDDDDRGECRWGTESELEPMYVDNVDLVEGVHHDVWELTIDDSEQFRFVTRAGSEAIVAWGDIDHVAGQAAARFRVVDGVAWPTDDFGVVLLNATNVPRLAGLKEWMLRELSDRSAERLEIAELVNTFAGIIANYSGVFGAAASANQPGRGVLE